MIAACLVGCGKTSTIIDPPPPDIIRDPPATADALMADFMYTYETMDPERLARLTDPQSFIILQASTTATFPDVGEFLDRAEQAQISSRMFSRQDVTDPNGNLVPGIQTIQFQTFQRVGSWGTSLPGDVIPNTECALYSVQVLFDRGQSYSTMKVTGNIRFYVSHRDSTYNGETYPFYQIIGQVDLTDSPPAKGDESASWGSIHALFR